MNIDYVHKEFYKQIHETKRNTKREPKGQKNIKVYNLDTFYFL